MGQLAFSAAGKEHKNTVIIIEQLAGFSPKVRKSRCGVGGVYGRIKMIRVDTLNES